MVLRGLFTQAKKRADEAGPTTEKAEVGCLETLPALPQAGPNVLSWGRWGDIRQLCRAPVRPEREQEDPIVTLFTRLVIKRESYSGFESCPHRLLGDLKEVTKPL